MNLEFIFDDITDFYKELELISPDGNTNYWKKLERGRDAGWVGLSKEDAIKYKFGYDPGVEKVPELKDMFEGVGASMFKYHWDERDGEEMNMERAYESMPFLKQRRRAIGNGIGKFVNVHVNIAELCNVSSNQMMYKAYTAASIINRLETLGYRVQVNVVTASSGTGYYKGENVRELIVRIPVKRFEEPLNMSMLLNCMSSWFFRRWIFLFWCSKIKTTDGLGRSLRLGKSDTKSDIYIDNGQCMNRESAQSKIRSIIELFELDK